MSSGKYTEEFFAKRIQDLQQKITSQLPSIDSTVKESFVISCAIVQSSAEAKGRALDLVRRLGWVNNPTEEAKESATNIFKACAEAHTKAEETFVATGRSILDKLHLASSIDEAALLECIILVESTPRRLAHWVAKDVPTNERLLDSFLGNVDWMKQMILAEEHPTAIMAEPLPFIPLYSSRLLPRTIQQLQCDTSWLWQQPWSMRFL